MAEQPTLGRRERKKAATRKAISNTATAMFLERGFDNVSVREIADRVDVSPTTVFAYFPQKEALVFDEDEEQREALVAAVRDRDPEVSITDALHRYFAAGILESRTEHGDGAQKFMEFLDATPALTDYAAGCGPDTNTPSGPRSPRISAWTRPLQRFARMPGSSSKYNYLRRRTTIRRPSLTGPSGS